MGLASIDHLKNTGKTLLKAAFLLGLYRVE